MLDFPIEMHCDTEEQDCVQQNKIIEDIRCTFAYEFRIVMTYSLVYERHNAYFFSATDDLYMEEDPDIIAENGFALSIELAKQLFPLYKFDEDNYGYIP
jgi:hypothetical protein